VDVFTNKPNDGDATVTAVTSDDPVPTGLDVDQDSQTNVDQTIEYDAVFPTV
jgi:hypothetical protein